MLKDKNKCTDCWTTLKRSIMGDMENIKEK